MDNRKLEYFLAVMESRNFARAATAMGVSQPAITKNIARLEEDLDVKLFERGLFGAVPTEYAMALEKRARLILAEAVTIRRELSALKDSSKGELYIGAGPSIAPRIMPEIIKRFRQRWPLVGISCEVASSAQLYAKVEKGELDLVVSSPPPRFEISSELKLEPLFEETDQIGMAVDHPLAQHTELKAEHLGQHPWVMSRGVGIWQTICDYMRAEGYDPPPHVLHTTSPDLAKGLMRTAGYLILVGNEHIYHEMASGEMVSSPLAGLKLKRTAYICQRQRATPKPTIANMLELIRTFCLQSKQGLTGFQLPN